MSRAVTSNWLAQAGAAVCAPVIFYEGTFSGLTLRLWSGVGDISWNGQIWQGNGWLRYIENMIESDEIAEHEFVVNLSGLPAQMVSIILGSTQHNAAGKIWFGFLSGSTVVDPYLWFDGLLDEPTLDDGAEDAQITIRYSTVLSLNDRTTQFKYDTETQRLFYPADKGFEFMTATLEWDGFWGTTKKQVAREKAMKQKNTNEGQGA